MVQSKEKEKGIVEEQEEEIVVDEAVGQGEEPEEATDGEEGAPAEGLSEERVGEEPTGTMSNGVSCTSVICGTFKRKVTLNLLENADNGPLGRYSRAVLGVSIPECPLVTGGWTPGRRFRTRAARETAVSQLRGLAPPVLQPAVGCRRSGRLAGRR
uniref:Prothymosin alpha-like n=1 Tax=Bursaphelenchus xylophilus TaxID=6326 RepID=A0A1I7SRQ1_BURXY